MVQVCNFIIHDLHVVLCTHKPSLVSFRDVFDPLPSQHPPTRFPCGKHCTAVVYRHTQQHGWTLKTGLSEESRKQN